MSTDRQKPVPISGPDSAVTEFSRIPHVYKLEHMPVSLRDCILNQPVNKPNTFSVIAITVFVNESIHRRVPGVLTHSLLGKKKKNPTKKPPKKNNNNQTPKKSSPNTNQKKPKTQKTSLKFNTNLKINNKIN